MPEYKFELERSAYFKNRTQLLKSSGTPKLSDAKMNLGGTVAGVVFDQCEEALREDFGLKVPLKGPGDILWVSPSDLLIGKIALKPPFTPKCLQALTHKGILEIGEDLENKFKQEMELDKQRVLEKYKTELLATIEDRMKSEIKDVEIRERLACHIEMEKQQQEFELLLRDELDKLEKIAREQYEELVANQESVLKAKWEHKLDKEVRKTVDLMTKNYQAQMHEQEEKFTEKFQLEMKKQELLRDFEFKLNKRKTMEALRQLKHNLECTNLVNMMYVLCTERTKCCEQKQDIENKYKTQIKQLEDRLKKKDTLLDKVTTEKEKEIVEVSIRETCLTEVIRHFQKFINFALRAAPTQAEFLLSVEKMMVFELTSKVATSEIKKNRETPAIIPWVHEGNSKTSSVHASGLEIHDFHDCFHELNPPINENAAELGENDILPAMYFKKKTYIREDFRDMLSSGVALSPSNELWNKNVELLVQDWQDEESDKSKKSDTIEKDSWNSYKIDVPSERRRSNKSTVQFSENGAPQSNRLSNDSRKLSCKSSLKPSAFPFVDDIDFEPVNVARFDSKLLAAKDSIEILLEKKQKSGVSLTTLEFRQKESIKEESEIQNFGEPSNLADLKQDVVKELVVETKDSVMMRMSEMAKTRSSGEFLVSPKDSIEVTKLTQEDKSFEVKPRPSKLTSARNSVEILRESLYKLKIPSLFCQRKDSKKQEHKEDKMLSQTGFTGTCCDRCKRKEVVDAATSDPTRDGDLSKTDSFGDERSVRISRIQIINLDDHVPTPSVVSFNNKPVYLRKSAPDKRSVPVEGKNVTATSLSKKSRKTRKNELSFNCKVAGDIELCEDQSNDEFTAERIHSLIKLMRDQPHLMQLFTAGLQ